MTRELPLAEVICFQLLHTSLESTNAPLGKKMGILIRLDGTSLLQYHFSKGRSAFQLAHVDCVDTYVFFGEFCPRD